MDIQVPLNKLRFGHDAGGINARVAGRSEGIEALAANLFAQGQIENLVVKPADDGTYAVSNGNRRLAAFHLIHGAEADIAIPCTLHEVDDARAFEQSLTTAVTAQQLHPVDQYEAFARMAERGKTNEEIARQYGMTDKEVRQALALGALSPKIRAAWRAGEIKAEVAKAFTLGTSHKMQDKVFARLDKAGHLYEHTIKRELGAGDHQIGPLLLLVGAEAYRTAGGEVVEDLFGASHVVSNPELLKQLATDHLARTCDELRAEGWSWVGLESELPRGARWWSRITPKPVYEGDEEDRITALRARLQAIENDDDLDFDDDSDVPLRADLRAIEAAVQRRSYTAKQKAKLGCIVGVDGGIVEILFGVTKPEEIASAKSKAKPSPAGDDAAAAEEPAISQALLHRLSLQLTEGAATALSQDLELSMIVLLAGIALGHDQHVRVSVRGLGSSSLDLLGGDDMADNIALLKGMQVPDRVKLVTSIAAAALDFQNCTLDGGRVSSAVAVCEAIDAKALNSALRGVFDAKDYFGGVSKGLALAAIGEALGPDLERQQAKRKRPEIAEFAIANVPQTGWLPRQLRAKGYDGPPVRSVIPASAEAAAGPTPAKTWAAKKPAKKSEVKKPAKKPAAKKPAKKSAAKKPAKKTKR